MCSVDTQSKVADAGKCWQMKGSGNLSRILGETPSVVTACVVCAGMFVKQKKLRNIVWSLSETAENRGTMF